MTFFKQLNRRTMGAAAVSAALLGSLGVLGAPALAGSASSSKQAAASQYQYKITICHKTHSKKHPWRQIRVSSASWKAHQKHGDFLVTPTTPCPPITPTTAASSTKGKSGDHGNNGNSGDHGNNGNSGDNGKAKGKGK